MKRPSKHALRLSATALRWAQFGYKSKVEQYAIGEVRLWLLHLAGPLQLEPRPHLLADNALLYAINSGPLYPTHMNMAHGGLPARQWRQWVRRHILYGWIHEVDPAWMMPVEVHRCARALQRYYQARVAEGRQ
jgi:hypothetical protein